MDPARALHHVHEMVLTTRSGDAPPDQILTALAALRSVREQLGAWEPELIAAARAAGASWASLAPALGVASRQAAERRFLRLQPQATGETTGEARVHAERDRRAGDRAVAEWARHNAAVLRQLASQISTLDHLNATARKSANQLGAALGDNDVTNLLPPLAAVRTHLTHDHTALADQLDAINDHTDQLRREAAGNRRTRTT